MVGFAGFVPGGIFFCGSFVIQIGKFPVMLVRWYLRPTGKSRTFHP